MKKKLTFVTYTLIETVIAKSIVIFDILPTEEI